MLAMQYCLKKISNTASGTATSNSQKLTTVMNTSMEISCRVICEVRKKLLVQELESGMQVQRNPRLTHVFHDIQRNTDVGLVLTEATSEKSRGKFKSVKCVSRVNLFKTLPANKGISIALNRGLWDVVRVCIN